MALEVKGEKKPTGIVVLVTVILFILILWRIANPPPPDYTVIRGNVQAGENTTIWLDFMPEPGDPPDYRVVVTFSAENIGIPGNITGYQWDFGDGRMGTGEVVTHEYPENQHIYFVTLVVTDDNLQQHTFNSAVEIAHMW